MTTLQLKARIAKRVASEHDEDKLELVLKWLETPTGIDRRDTLLVRSVLKAEMEHLEGKGLTVDEARKKVKAAIRRGK